MTRALVLGLMLLVGCSEPVNEVSESAVGPAPTPTISNIPVPQPSASPAPASAAPEILGPYSPRGENPLPTASASAGEPEGPPKSIGTHKDWLKHYQGSGEPDTHPPPQLGTLKDLPALATSTLVYVRGGHLIRTDFPLGRETPLTSGPTTNLYPTFTRDGAWLFFQSNRSDAVDRVYRMRPDGSAITAVTGKLDKNDEKRWEVSDDGSTIAYLQRAGDRGENAIHVVDVASQSDREVYRGQSVDYVSFARNGRSLYFVDGFLEVGPQAEHPQSLRRLDLANGKAERLPNAGYTQITQPWDLGDGRLLFVATMDFSMVGRKPRVFEMPAAGGAWAKVGTVEAPIGYIHFAPSFDRKKLAIGWSRRLGGFGADFEVDISVEPVTGGSPRRVSEKFPRPFYSASQPSWSPDNRHLAFLLTLCPYMGCKPEMRSVVVVDTEATTPTLAFIGYGGSPTFAPITKALAPAIDARQR